MRKTWRVIRHLFGFAEKVHTLLWLAEVIGIWAMITALYRIVAHYCQLHTDWTVTGVFFLAGIGLLTLPKLFYWLFRWWKTSSPIFTIRFNHLPGNILDNGWVRAYPPNTNVRPNAMLAIGAPVAGSVMIDAPEGHAYDYRPERYVTPADSLSYAAKYSGSTMIFVQFELASEDGHQIQYKWVKFEIGKGEPYQTKGYEEHEYTFPDMGQQLPDGWRRFKFHLPEVINKTWARRGLFFRRVTVFRIRGSLGISPIEFWETRQ
jgi:hypothetical protein